jgi:hypothetical protein
MSRKSPARAVGGALVAAFGVVTVLVTPACAPECTDKFDCASKARPGEVLTCDDGRCVPGNPSGTGGGAGGGAVGGGAGGGSDVGGGTGGGGGGAMDAGAGGGGGDADAGAGGGGGDADAGAGGGGGDTDAGTGGGGGDTDAGTGGGTGGGMSIAGTYTAKLTDTQQVPPNSQGTSGSGTFTLSELADGGYNVAWNVTHDIPNGLLLAAHIHTALGGANGPVLVSLGTSLQSPIVGNADITPAQALDLSEGRTYVNIHTTRNPGGEIRGQILRPGQFLATAILAPVTRPDGGMTTGSGNLQAILTNPDGGPVFVPGESVVAYEGAWTVTATKASVRIDLTDGGIEEIFVLTLTDGGLGAKGTAMPSSSSLGYPYLLVEDADGPALRAPLVGH